MYQFLARKTPPGAWGVRRWQCPLGLAAVALLALVLGCSRSGAEQPRGVAVVATTYPLQYFASQVGGGLVRVVGLVPVGVEPHDWEPTPQDIVAIDKAAVFIHGGAIFEPWVDRALESVRSRQIIVVDTSQGLAVQGEGEADDSNQGTHFWLDPILAIQQVAAIRDALVQADPEHASAYQSNARELTLRLEELDGRFSNGLADCQRRSIIVSHDAFGYLARRYGLEVHSIAGLSPEMEPSPSRLAGLIETAQKLGVTHIFFETLVSPAMAQTIAREVGAETLVLNPVEGLTKEEKSQGEDYFGLMEANLKNLQLALGCESEQQ